MSILKKYFSLLIKIKKLKIIRNKLKEKDIFVCTATKQINKEI